MCRAVFHACTPSCKTPKWLFQGKAIIASTPNLQKNSSKHLFCARDREGQFVRTNCLLGGVWLVACPFGWFGTSTANNRLISVMPPRRNPPQVKSTPELLLFFFGCTGICLVTRCEAGALAQRVTTDTTRADQACFDAPMHARSHRAARDGQPLAQGVMFTFDVGNAVDSNKSLQTK